MSPLTSLPHVPSMDLWALEGDFRCRATSVSSAGTPVGDDQMALDLVIREATAGGSLSLDWVESARRATGPNETCFNLRAATKPRLLVRSLPGEAGS